MPETSEIYLSSTAWKGKKFLEVISILAFRMLDPVAPSTSHNRSLTLKKRSLRNTSEVNSVPSSFWLQVAACFKDGKHPLLQAKILSNFILKLLQKDPGSVSSTCKHIKLTAAVKPGHSPALPQRQLLWRSISVPHAPSFWQSAEVLGEVTEGKISSQLEDREDHNDKFH